MRIDLEHSPYRPWYLRLALRMAQLHVGIKPGPLLVMSYRPQLFSAQMRDYVNRGVAYSSSFSKGESELIGAFVSDLNTCHF